MDYVSTNKQIEDTNYRWYVLSVVSGQEPIVVKNLWERIKNEKLQKQVEEVFYPVVKTVTITKKGEKKIVEKKIHPGYIYVKSMMNDKIWYVLRNTPGVRLIIGSEIYPTPVSDEEMKKIIEKVKKSEERLQMDIPYQVGDIVKLREEELGGIEGEIVDINKDSGEVKIKTKLMGRETIINVGFDKIDKLTN